MKIKLTFLFVMITASIFAQDLTGIKIYINPGHGGHDSDDRYIAETGFWESEGNLTKGLYLRDFLLGLNATVDISRTTNNTSDDLPLSVIDQLANQFGADYFHSIHSNALNGQINYPLVLFRGYDDGPVFPEAKNMALLMFDQLLLDGRGFWIYSWKNARGDWDFYPWGTSGLGVLRTLTMPGTLSEGSFHDYIPESWRLMNLDFRKNEAYALARSFLQYFNQPGYPQGMITGVIRDNDQNTSYYGIPQVNDNKKPVNNVMVTLQPGNRIYQGDELNNGFFIFDSLTPGSYTIYYNSPEYELDSSTVTVLANKSTKADKFLQFDTSIPPEIVSHFPLDDPDSVETITPIDVVFSREMNPASVEAAFSINPSAAGSFAWSSGNKSVEFTPDEPLQKSTRYSVMIDTSAQSVFGVGLDSNYVFEFTTKNRNKLLLEFTYPENNQVEVSMTVQMRLIFDAPVAFGSLGGNIDLFDEQNTRITVSNVNVFAENGKGVIYFEPKDPLNRNAAYHLVLGSGIKDEIGFPLGEDITINFRTTTQQYVSGNVIDDLESIGGWVKPAQGSGTAGIDTLLSDFVLSGTRTISGAKSGKLTYAFTGSDGVCQLYNSTEPVIGSNASSNFGVWVFGDLSLNFLELWFTDQQANLIKKGIDTIDWTGWKLEQISIGDIQGSGDIKFNSIVIKQTASGVTSGEVYIDDLQTDVTTGIEDEFAAVPKVFRLEQNYPNPFNPATTIKFQIPNDSKVVLKVYDILGNELTQLIDRFVPAGTYSVNFDASGYSSGVYFYTIQAADKFETKKMILLK